MYTVGQKCDACGEKLEYTSETCKVLKGWEPKAEYLHQACYAARMRYASIGSTLLVEIVRAVAAAVHVEVTESLK
jgi:hypothetical protein